MQLRLQGLEEFVRRAGRPEQEIAVAAENRAYQLSERQAKAILDMRLNRLTGLEQDKIVTEFNELLELIRDLGEILARPERLDGVIKEEILAIREEFATPRKCEITYDDGEMSIEDLVDDKELVVVLTQAGYAPTVAAIEGPTSGSAV